jgi:acetylornithine/succinyldiaminopimelate/putrescine aminotransferase
MTTYLDNEIKEKVWDKLIRLEGLPTGSKAAVELKEELKDNDTVDNAIEAAIVITAQKIFAEIASKQKIVQEVKGTGIVETRDLKGMEHKWLHDACDFCNTRKTSLIQRGDNKRICARCEVSEAYTKAEIEKVHKRNG